MAASQTLTTPWLEVARLVEGSLSLAGVIGGLLCAPVVVLAFDHLNQGSEHFEFLGLQIEFNGDDCNLSGDSALGDLI